MFASIILVSEEYGITHYRSVTTVTTSLRSTILLLPKTTRSQAEKFPDSRNNRLHDKTIRIQKCSHSKSHFKFGIQNLRKLD